ncbi:MAG: ParB/RepB/Spo0J family partition protein, partial [Deltaproteobacteria bacterium]|nr:ParB/RepB/Spo0J family partition protein [Deltaproteobacteria bacterium]
MARKKLVLANNPLLSGPGLSDREKGGTPYREIRLNAIDRDPNQPRVNFDEEKLDELAQSILTYGVLTPILVTPAKVPGKYRLIAGERRLRASLKAGLPTIPAIIEHSDEGDDRTLAVQLVENLQRADLTPLERAHAIGALKETYSLSIRQIAEKLGVSKGMVQRSLEILDLPDDLLNALREGASESKVLLLAKIDDADVRASYLQDIDALTRNELKKNLDTASSTKTASASANLQPEDIRIAEEIQRSLGMKVKMARPSKGVEQGKLTIEFYSNEDLQEVFRRLIAN